MRVPFISLAILLVLANFLSLTSAANVSGRLQSLNGEGEKGITVVATRTDAASATPITAVSDVNGDYSLAASAGSYEVSVQLSGATADAASARLLRATPARSTVTVGSAAIKHVDFIVFRRPSKFDLSGEVVGLGSEGIKHVGTLEVQLALASNPTNVLQKSNLMAKALPYFEFTNLPTDTYIVTVKTSLNPRTYSFNSASVTVALTASAHIQPVVEISYKMSSVHEMQSNSIWSTVFLIAVVAALMNKDKSVVLGKALLKSAQTRNPSHFTNAIASLTSSSSGNAAASFAPSEDVSKSSNKDKKSKFPVKKEKTHVSTFVRYDSLPASERPQPAAEVAAPTPAPAPKPVVKPTPAPAPAAAKRAHTPAPPMEKEKPATPAPAPAAVKKPAPQAAPAPVPAVVKPTPVAAPAAAAASASAGVKFCPECGAKRENAAGKFCVECGHKF